MAPNACFSTQICWVKSFLDATVYYKSYIKVYMQKAKMFTDLLCKNIMWRWKPRQEAAFQALKAALTDVSVLTHANNSKPFIYDLNASKCTIVRLLKVDLILEVLP